MGRKNASMSVKALHTDYELLQLIAAGDQRAFRLLYKKYHPVIFAFTYHLSGSKQEAQDIVQETMLYVWQHAGELSTMEKPLAFLKTYVKRRGIDMLRKQLTAQKSEATFGRNWQEAENETEQSMLLKDVRDQIEAAVSKLPKQQQQVYRLCYQQGLKYEEAAEQLKISRGTVQKHMKLALRALREQLKNNISYAALLIILKFL
ncbi:RNA polymerase sigma factor [Mucilaginibacter pineti]|nr:RNA polymerase sigma-70 factor [Mucilaginibacter pineti]